MREKKKKKKKGRGGGGAGGSFFFCEKRILTSRCSILRVLPTSTSCRPSKKCLSFPLSLSDRNRESERKKPEKKKKKKKNCLEHQHHENQREKRVSKQAMHSSSRFLPLLVIDVSRSEKYVHSRLEAEGSTRVSSSLSNVSYLAIRMFLFPLLPRLRRQC